jgi:hypothetical protein
LPRRLAARSMKGLAGAIGVHNSLNLERLTD